MSQGEPCSAVWDDTVTVWECFSENPFASYKLSDFRQMNEERLNYATCFAAVAVIQGSIFFLLFTLFACSPQSQEFTLCWSQNSISTVTVRAAFLFLLGHYLLN